MKKIFLVLLFFSSFIFAENIKFYNPSFDCNQVQKSTIEYKVCTNSVLSILDVRLSNIYKLLINIKQLNRRKIKQEQKEWIKYRNRCKYIDYKCTKNSYIKRIKKLNYIYDLVIQNDFSPYEKILVSNPDEESLDKSTKYHLRCIYNKDSKSLVIARDRDLYFIDELSHKISKPTKNGAYWEISVHENFIEKTSKEQILKGTLFLNNGATYQPTAIEFFTHSKNWNCKLETKKN